jgi:hypothetical protein
MKRQPGHATHSRPIFSSVALHDSVIDICLSPWRYRRERDGQHRRDEHLLVRDENGLTEPCAGPFGSDPGRECEDCQPEAGGTRQSPALADAPDVLAGETRLLEPGANLLLVAVDLQERE